MRARWAPRDQSRRAMAAPMLEVRVSQLHHDLGNRLVFDTCLAGGGDGFQFFDWCRKDGEATEKCELPSGSARDEDELALDFVINLSHGVTDN